MKKILLLLFALGVAFSYSSEKLPTQEQLQDQKNELEHQLRNEHNTIEELKVTLDRDQIDQKDIQAQIDEKLRELRNRPWGSDTSDIQAHLKTLAADKKEIDETIAQSQEGMKQSQEKINELTRKLELLNSELQNLMSSGSEQPVTPKTVSQRIGDFFSSVWNSVKNLFSRAKHPETNKASVMAEKESDFSHAQEELTKYELEIINEQKEENIDELSWQALQEQRNKAKFGTAYYKYVQDYKNAQDSLKEAFKASTELQDMIKKSINEIPSTIYIQDPASFANPASFSDSSQIKSYQDKINGYQEAIRQYKVQRDDIARLLYHGGQLPIDISDTIKDSMYEFSHDEKNPYSALGILDVRRYVVNRDGIKKIFSSIKNPTAEQKNAYRELQVNKEQIDNRLDLIKTIYDLIYQDPQFTSALKEQFDKELARSQSQLQKMNDSLTQISSAVNQLLQKQAQNQSSLGNL